MLLYSFSDRSRDFEVIGKIGSGGFGSVYLVSLNSESQQQQQQHQPITSKATKGVFAMKVIDKVDDIGKTICECSNHLNSGLLKSRSIQILDA